jgi:hypothetical protein
MFTLKLYFLILCFLIKKLTSISYNLLQVKFFYNILVFVLYNQQVTIWCKWQACYVDITRDDFAFGCL